MFDGPAVEMPTRITAPHVEKAPAKNFTPHPEFTRPTRTEPLQYEEPNHTISPEDDRLTKQLMAQIMDKPATQEPQEAIAEVERKIPPEKKTQGFLANIWSSILRFFGLR